MFSAVILYFIWFFIICIKRALRWTDSGSDFAGGRHWLTRLVVFCRLLFFMPLEWYFRTPVLGHHHTSRQHLSLFIFMFLHVVHCFSRFWGENSVCGNDRTKSLCLPLICSVYYFFSSMNVLSATLNLDYYHLYAKICLITWSLQLSFNFSRI